MANAFRTWPAIGLVMVAVLFSACVGNPPPEVPQIGLDDAFFDDSTCQWTIHVTSASLVEPVTQYRFVVKTPSRTLNDTLGDDLVHTGPGSQRSPAMLQPGDNLTLGQVTEAGMYLLEVVYVPVGEPSSGIARPMRGCEPSA